MSSATYLPTELLAYIFSLGWGEEGILNVRFVANTLGKLRWTKRMKCTTDEDVVIKERAMKEVVKDLYLFRFMPASKIAKVRLVDHFNFSLYSFEESTLITNFLHANHHLTPFRKTPPKWDVFHRETSLKALAAHLPTLTFKIDGMSIVFFGESNLIEVKGRIVSSIFGNSDDNYEENVHMYGYDLKKYPMICLKGYLLDLRASETGLVYPYDESNGRTYWYNPNSTQIAIA